MAEQEVLEVKVKSLSHEGRGIAHHPNGKIIFIDAVLPDEQVKIAIYKRHSRFDEARPIEILTPHPDRVEPYCPHYSACGGCSLQHLSPSSQLLIKQQQLQEQLLHFGGVIPKQWLPPLEGPSWNYRHKARLGVKDVIKKGKVLVGFREKRSQGIVEMDICPVLAKPVDELIAPLQRLIESLTVRKQVPQIEIAVGENQTAFIIRHLADFTPSDHEKLAAFANQYNIVIYSQPKGYDSIHILYPANAEPLVNYSLQKYGFTFYFHPAQFSQVNPYINEQMVDLAIQKLELKETDSTADLFCGFGNFSLPMAKFCKHVVGVEGNAEAVKQARLNAQFNQIENTEFFVEDLSQVEYAPLWSHKKFNKILLDPPRSGAEALIPWILQQLPERIVYISCNPATFARDVGLLVKNSTYILEEAGILDMFPHTQHVESIGVLVKKKSND